jgi:predicted peptidase
MAQENKLNREEIKRQIDGLVLFSDEIASHHGISRQRLYDIAASYGIDMGIRAELMRLVNEQRHIQDQINQLTISYHRRT